MSAELLIALVMGFFLILATFMSGPKPIGTMTIAGRSAE